MLLVRCLNRPNIPEDLYLRRDCSLPCWIATSPGIERARKRGKYPRRAELSVSMPPEYISILRTPKHDADTRTAKIMPPMEPKAFLPTAYKAISWLKKILVNNTVRTTAIASLASSTFRGSMI